MKEGIYNFLVTNGPSDGLTIGTTLGIHNMPQPGGAAGSNAGYVTGALLEALIKDNRVAITSPPNQHPTIYKAV
jgi:hypothetical protein